MSQAVTEIASVRHPMFATAEPAAAAAHLSALFRPHELRVAPGRERFHFRHRRFCIDGVSFNALRYGRAVVIDAAPADSAYLVKFTFAGRSTVRQDGATLTATAGMVCAMNPLRPLHVTLSGDHDQLTMQIDAVRLQRRLAQALGRPLEAPLEFLPHARAFGNAAGLARLVRAVYAGTAACGVELPVPHALEDALMALVLCELPHTYSASLHAERGAPPAHIRARLRALVLAHPAGMLQVGDIARALGLNVRALQLACQRECGMSPMAYVRSLRLQLAHEMLRERGSRDTVTGVALACGFPHMSRFAQHYRERYGESPSATARKGRAERGRPG